MIATVRVILEAPQVNQLVNGPHVAGEIANQLLAEASILQRRPAFFTIKLGRFGHLANVQSVGAELIDSHDFLLFPAFSSRFGRLYQQWKRAFGSLGSTVSIYHISKITRLTSQNVGGVISTR